MKKNGLQILISNDDGWDAKGLQVIAAHMRKYGHVTVVAPATGQSGKSAALTLFTDLYLNKLQEEPGYRLFSFSGSPVDCIKMGMRIFESEGRRPDLVVTGINHGSNATAASAYSGTIGAAAEGAFYGLPAIGFSLTSHEPDADFTPVTDYADLILEKFFENTPPAGIYLNINFPAIPSDQIKGIRIAHQGAGSWRREFDEVRDAQGRDCFRMSGTLLDLEKEYISGGYLQGDHRLLDDGYISIVPHRIDTTDYDVAARMARDWKCDTIS
ncbi:MAG: 5'/3'-nucleotidase SurE [Bacteroidales bacterium]|nr:5'/3'-nucleotidase SurE [Bacteroidales bacterium]